MVYDFDGDGKAELICKTAAGSKDGAGNYVSEAATDATIKAVNNTKDWRNSSGKVTGGQEWLTVFNGETGKAESNEHLCRRRARHSQAKGEAQYSHAAEKPLGIRCGRRPPRAFHARPARNCP